MTEATATPDIPISFAHSSANEIFPTLLWIADLAPTTYEPLSHRIAAKLDEILGTRKQSYMSETFHTDQHLQQHRDGGKAGPPCAVSGLAEA